MNITKLKKNYSIFFVSYIVLYYIWSFVMAGNKVILIAGIDLFDFISSLICFLLISFILYKNQCKNKVFWILINISVLCYLLGSIAWFYCQTFLNVPPYVPGIADIFWLSMYPIILISMIYRICKLKNKYQTMRNVFDIIIFMLMAMSLSWNFLLEPVIKNIYKNTSYFNTIYLGYPIGDLGMILAVLLLLYIPKIFPKNVARFLGLGFLSYFIADTLYCYFVEMNTYKPGNLYTPLYSVAFFMIGLSILYDCTDSESETSDLIKTNFKNKSRTIHIMMPYLIIIFSAILIDIKIKNFIVLGFAISVLLLVVRQIAVIFENFTLIDKFSSLNRELENKIIDRTAELAESKQQYMSLFQKHPDAAFVLNLDGIVLNINSAAEKLTCFSSDDLFRKSFFSLINEETSEEASDYFIKAKNGTPQSTEVALINSRKEKLLAEITYIPIIIEGRITGMFSILKNITDEKAIQEKIKHLAFHDALTGLPNRRLYEKLLNQTIANCKRENEMASVMFLDLDRFKTVNDSLGHDIGDLLLSSVAARIKSVLRDNDILARQGGDEFTVLLPSINNTKGAAVVAEKIIDALRAPFNICYNKINIGCSIGISFYPSDGEDSITLMKNADAAMYRIKYNGKNNYSFYSEDIRIKISDEYKMEMELKQAIINNELILYYQPQVDIKTNKLIGFEALIRWCHPKLGLVPPVKFIPFAEETGLIIDIGQWVIKTVCLQIEEWLHRGFNPGRISINISALEFYQNNFIDNVKKILNETHIDPSYLEFEITEGVAMKRQNEVINKLEQIRKFGINLSIDDFGTGYSSLSYLKNFPVKSLKIPYEFVKDISKGSSDKAVISAIIALASKLNMSVIAEGVETKSQIDFLSEQNCNFIQGFYFSRPVPADEVENTLKNMNFN